jgi:hypothetical protein
MEKYWYKIVKMGKEGRKCHFSEKFVQIARV